MSNLLMWASSGYKDWVWQRISAVIFLIYALIVISYWAFFPEANLGDWRSFLLNTYMKSLGTVALISFVIHAWIGLWTVITDYIKPIIVNRFAVITVLTLLFSYFVFGIFVFWG